MKHRISLCVNCGLGTVGLVTGGFITDVDGSKHILGVRVECICCHTRSTDWAPQSWKDADRRAVRSWNGEMRSRKLHKWLSQHPRANHSYLLKWLFVQYCRVGWWMRFTLFPFFASFGKEKKR